MGTIIPPGGFPPPATIPGPPATGPVLELPAVIPGSVTAAPDSGPSNTLTIPRVYPAPNATSATIAPGNMQYYHWFWHADAKIWTALLQNNQPWDRWPLGFYVSSNLLGFNSPTFEDNVQVIVVVARVDPSGALQPNVLEPPPFNAAQSDQCPAGMTLINDPTTTDLTLGGWCAYFTPQQPQSVPNCPSGTVWNPASETCVPITIPPLPPPVIPPPPSGGPNPVPPPPGPQGGPDPDGDSITTELCNQLWQQTAQIIAAIKGIGGAPSPAPDDSATDQLLINALITLNATLDSFQTFLANLTNAPNGANADPVTCAQLTAQFDKLITAITAGDKSIADALAHSSSPGPDANVKRIADAQNGAPADVAPVEAQLDQLLQLAVDKYGFPADFAQILKA